MAHAAIGTWVIRALVDVVLAQLTRKPGRTGARKRINAIDARREVQARVRITIVNVNLTVRAAKAWLAGTGIGRHPICACAAIEAWVEVDGVPALIDVELTIFPGVSCGAGTLVI